MRAMFWFSMWTILVVVCAFSYAAMAHQAPAGWSYDPLCCSNQDCRPVERTWTEGGTIRMETQGKIYTIPQSIIPKMSQDAENHICINQYTDNVLCVYLASGI